MKLTTAALVLTIIANAPAFAGGPVIVEETTEAAPLVRSHNNKLVPILFGLAVAAIILSNGGGSEVCTVQEPEPEPAPGC